MLHFSHGEKLPPVLVQQMLISMFPASASNHSGACSVYDGIEDHKLRPIGKMDSFQQILMAVGFEAFLKSLF